MGQEAKLLVLAELKLNFLLKQFFLPRSWRWNLLTCDEVKRLWACCHFWDKITDSDSIQTIWKKAYVQTRRNLKWKSQARKIWPSDRMKHVLKIKSPLAEWGFEFSPTQTVTGCRDQQLIWPAGSWAPFHSFLSRFSVFYRLPVRHAWGRINKFHLQMWASSLITDMGAA